MVLINGGRSHLLFLHRLSLLLQALIDMLKIEETPNNFSSIFAELFLFLSLNVSDEFLDQWTMWHDLLGHDIINGITLVRVFSQNVDQQHFKERQNR